MTLAELKTKRIEDIKEKRFRAATAEFLALKKQIERLGPIAPAELLDKAQEAQDKMIQYGTD